MKFDFCALAREVFYIMSSFFFEFILTIEQLINNTNHHNVENA